MSPMSPTHIHKAGHGNQCAKSRVLWVHLLLPSRVLGRLPAPLFCQNCLLRAHIVLQSCCNLALPNSFFCGVCNLKASAQKGPPSNSRCAKRRPFLDCYWVGSLNFNFFLLKSMCFPLNPQRVFFQTSLQQTNVWGSLGVLG